jgi:TolA-binding protein
MLKVLTRTILILLVLSSFLTELSGQALSFDLKKPKKYEEKQLPSEKSADKKFTVVRRFTQNAFTKFNWNFNASARLAEVIARAKAAHKDNYNELLSFYNYSLDATAQSKTDLDSVIYKANAGILVHDLRNSWIDNLYLTMGQAYYFKKELDTAYFTFQYINYAFAPKEKDGYDIPIGSNANEGGNAFSVSTREKTNLAHKIWTTPPSRNESLVWQIKTYIAKQEFSLAAGLIETLKADPNFPDRLKTDLNEVQAHWFYEQNVYDSAAFYLEKALPNAANNLETARWEFLIGQLYERAGAHKEASEFFQRATRHTYNPVLELYARLNTIRQNKGDDKVIADNIEALLKMARRDRYTNYRDIIYYTAAQMELERNNTAGARLLLIKATTVQVNNPENSRRLESFLLLADLSFREKQYSDSKRFYDSVNVSDLPAESAKQIEERKRLLARIVEQTDVIYRQDSLQRIAAMPESERNAFIKKLAKQLRKQRGIREDDSTASGRSDINNKNAGTDDLFGTNSKGDWYFQNASLKSRGFTEFKGKWGNRPNTDNWRRSSAASRLPSGQQQGVPTPENNTVAAAPAEISFEGLLKPVPLTPEQMKISNDSLERAKFMLGKVLTVGAEDFESAIAVLEEFIGKYPGSLQRPEALFLLYYCYTKMGNSAKAAAAKNSLEQKYPGSSFQKTVTDPKGGPEQKAREDMTKRYENIYSLFIEGRFDEALAQKRIADSLYGKNYWTPQLLYIETIYHIRQKDDAKAKTLLQQIISLYPSSALTPRAKSLIDVLNRRREIEDYLTKLQIERPKEDSALAITDETPGRVQPPVVKKEEPVTVPTVPEPARTQPDTEKQKAEDLAKQKADAVAKDSARKIAELAAKDSAQKAQDLAGQKPVQPVKDSAQQKPVIAKKDSARAVINSIFAADDNAPHFVVVILEKVDPVYVSEARNAFNRYNRQAYYNKQMEVNNQPLNDSTTLVLTSPFQNAAEALEYMEKTRKIAATEIVPWMPAGKLNFVVISAANLETLKNTPDLKEYRKFIRQAYPGKFDR